MTVSCFIPDSDFHRLENEWLRLAHEGDTESIDSASLRGWLREAPQRLHQTSLAAWTSLTATLVWATRDDHVPSLEDALLVRSVLDHALTVPMHVWLKEGQRLVNEKTNSNPPVDEDSPEQPSARPAYDALNWLIKTLVYPTTDPARLVPLTAIVQSGWEPGPLVHHLDQAREIQCLYFQEFQEAQDRNYGDFPDTAQRSLLEGVLTVMGTSPWRPERHAVWAQLWDKEVHQYYKTQSYDAGYMSISEQEQNKQRQMQSARAVWTSFPEHAAHALAMYANSPSLRHHLDTVQLFPFPFEQCHGIQTLSILLNCWQQRGDSHRGSKSICEQLAAHHPDIANLLEMHCSFYAQPNHAMKAIDAIVEPFHQLIGLNKLQLLRIPDLDWSA